MRWVFVLLMLAGLCLPGVAAATQPPGMLRLAQAEDVKPLAQILQTIGQRFPGHALDAELVRQGEPRYRVKWLGEDGKVREITADARSGQILDVR
ncbi:MAG: PepSY domain-containing protein [Geminicoccaceae bacterium]